MTPDTAPLPEQVQKLARRLEEFAFLYGHGVPGKQKTADDCEAAAALILAQSAELAEVRQERDQYMIASKMRPLPYADTDAGLIAQVNELRAEFDAAWKVLAEAQMPSTDHICNSIKQLVDEKVAAESELARLRACERRLDDMLPLFEEARDALQGITLSSAKLHNISLSLGDRMDEVGVAENWKAKDAARQPIQPEGR